MMGRFMIYFGHYDCDPAMISCAHCPTQEIESKLYYAAIMQSLANWIAL